MPNQRKEIPNQKFKVERLAYESLINETVFKDLYNRQVYFVDTDLKSRSYFKLGFSPEMILTAGKNLITIKGVPGMLAQNTPLLIEAVDITGLPLKTSVYDLKNETSDKVISIEVHKATPAGDIRLTLAGTALRDPNGKSMPPAWQNEINFKWTQVFEARPFTANRSDILFNAETTPKITVKEVIKPWNKLTYNQDLVTNVLAATSSVNIRSNYRLQTHGNTRSKVSYRKSGGHYFITAHPHAGNILDFGGFTADMVGGQLIVAEPKNPRPRSVAGYDAPQVYSPIERGDDFKIIIAVTNSDGSNVTQSSGTCFSDDSEDNLFTEVYIAGAYQTTVLEFISPFEIRVKDPHTTWQGLVEETFRKFEHTQFGPSAYRLIWNQRPQSCDPTPLDDNGIAMPNSYAQVKLTNLTPAAGDVTRIKSYTRNNQSPADWQLASDMNVNAKEMLYCEKETCMTPAGDFSKWGVGDGGIMGVLPFWDAEGKGTFDPPLGLYYQQGAEDAPPTPDSLIVGNNSGSTKLTNNNHWILYSKLFPEFKKGKMYQLEVSSVSTKTQETSWLPSVAPLGDPEIEIFMSGSSFVDDVNDDYNYGKRIGRIKTAADKEKHVEQDRYNKDLSLGYKFLFTADDDGVGKPLIKINSGIWQFWNISLKPLDLFGFTPEEFEITFPTPKCDVKQSEAIDFKFEFYNDYGTIANYSAEINNINWTNKHTAVFDNIVTNKLYADFLISTSSIINLQPVTFSSGINVIGDSTIGSDCTQSLILKADLQFPCLPSMSDNRIVTYNPNTQRMGYSSTSSHAFGATESVSPVQHSFMTVATGFGQPYVSAQGLNDVLYVIGDGNLTKTYTSSASGGSLVIGQRMHPKFIRPVTASLGLFSSHRTVLSGSGFEGSSATGSGTYIQGYAEIGTCCTDDITLRSTTLKMKCLEYWPTPTSILSYDYPTRRVYWSDVADLPGGGTGELGPCGASSSFTKMAVNTAEGETLITASICGDSFHLYQGANISLTPTRSGVIVSSPLQRTFKTILTTHNAAGGTTGNPGFGANGPDSTMVISGSSGIRVKAKPSANYGGTQVSVMEIDYVPTAAEQPPLQFHWSGKHLLGNNGLGADDRNYYTIDPDRGMNYHEFDNPTIFEYNEELFELANNIFSASYNYQSAGWVVPRNGYLNSMQGTWRCDADGETSMSIQIIRIKRSSLYKQLSNSSPGHNSFYGCNTLVSADGGATTGDKYTLFTCSIKINDANQGAGCRYEISASSLFPQIEIKAGDVLVPFIACVRPALQANNTNTFNISLALG